MSDNETNEPLAQDPRERADSPPPERTTDERLDALETGLEGVACAGALLSGRVEELENAVGSLRRDIDVLRAAVTELCKHTCPHLVPTLAQPLQSPQAPAQA